MNQSLSYYESSSASSSAAGGSFEVLEEEEEQQQHEEVHNKPVIQKEFPRKRTKPLLLDGGKENQINRTTPQGRSFAPPRKSLLDRKEGAVTIRTQGQKNETLKHRLRRRHGRLSDQPKLQNVNNNSHTQTPSAQEDDDDDDLPWSPDLDDILSEYDERVRSVYMESAAADIESCSNDPDETSEEHDLPDSSIQFFREFNLSEEWPFVVSMEDQGTSPLMVQPPRRRNVSLHPLREDSSTSIEASPISSNEAILAQDAPSESPNSTTSSSNQSSPSFVVATRRRRLSVVAPVINNDHNSSIAADTTSSSSSSSSESGNESDEGSSEGQATVIADREELLGGLPVHEGRTVLTAISERRVALDVDMFEHRRLALECHKLRDRLRQALTENHDKSRDFQRLQLETPKLQAQLVEARNEISHLKQELRRYQV